MYIFVKHEVIEDIYLTCNVGWLTHAAQRIVEQEWSTEHFLLLTIKAQKIAVVHLSIKIASSIQYQHNLPLAVAWITYENCTSITERSAYGHYWLAVTEHINVAIANRWIELQTSGTLLMSPDAINTSIESATVIGIGHMQ